MMNRRTLARRVLTGAHLGAAALAGFGCADASLAGPPSREPFVYLIISPEAPADSFGPSPDTALQALLLTAGSAAGAPFRTADRFDITSTAGGAPFVFVARTTGAATPGVARNGASVNEGNYVLLFAGTSTARGANELVPLGIYDLHIESEGRTITGRVVMPDQPKPFILEEGGTRWISFPSVVGAAAYYVGGDIQAFPRISTVTKVPLRDDARNAFVIALDSNLVQYVSDTLVARSGVNGALGLFGAATLARIAVPPP
jgi:hypothetical protein